MIGISLIYLNYFFFDSDAMFSVSMRDRRGRRADERQVKK